jgi:hypothetical protein
MVRREASCPLCGARMQAEELLDACGEIIDAGLGVLACRCPYCQGYLEAMPAAGSVAIGYLMNGLFDAALSLPCEGLEVERAEGKTALKLRTPNRDWEFCE